MHSPRTAYWFLAPALILYLAFVAVPIAQVVGYSFFSWDSGQLDQFVGFANFARLGTDSVFWAALWHNAVWVVLTLAFPLLAGLLLSAILAERRPNTVRALAAIYFIPRTIPLVVAGIIWGWIYNPIFGLLNYGLDILGLGQFAHAWLAEESTALFSLNVVGAWTFFGFCVVIYLAAIQSIDPSLYEAADIDGAGWGAKFRDITVPLLRNSTLFLGLYAAIEAMRFFDLIWVTTQGGPGYATEVLTTHVYKTFFLVGDFGYAAVLSVVLLVIVLSLASLSFWLLRSR
ncbi:sugar ABC transporter permease [Ponticoccus sp. SC2-23]|uniref:carbohydrate ABC transporter permease n=1 Tax=Alexandriicola marinus TaxID=2081710 RepID=UPI000FD8D3F0|nr:sugar ABC transporter permease [Alexandriicola marinus]MBM1220197.1 sugar ABC transporter permease [Ponticoccus sp. SC6-9]MBM1224883.1 sugar ABC transporter permease [Ponticoccus sp. SC6-15]MBM1228397.1 sugar ABC transporter permease [Ponticoccus sp. SC6-38]MBM1233966.1 sugar ABC transporter permease [Ponticoccus sp. SC6-45]MBM1238898.1 sugar ABC transporter permease [Ponticoccus sp. SC6-49]MBM1242680.1 sugar ABC transporter permease [Ponticoccus sp. SC2-64]MBM1247490.1 sugar ABC transpor